MNARKQILQGTLLVLSAIACLAPGCEGDVLKDPTFRLWCGESLCDWKIDTGTVQRVPTWHPTDYGVSFVATPSQISQESAQGSDCMEFSAVANVDASAQVKIQVDLNLDGTIDFEAPIAETNWRPAKILIHGPKNVGEQLRFVVRKEGVGNAVLAELRLRRVDTCTGPRVTIKDLPVGARCGDGAECTSGDCCLGTCSQCCPGESAGGCSGQVECAVPAQLPPGLSPYVLPRFPWLCGPGTHIGLGAAACVAASDCVSNACDGAIYHPAASCADGGTSGCFDGVIAGHCR